MIQAIPFATARLTANSNSVPADAAATLVGTTWVFYSPSLVQQVNPQFNNLSQADKNALLLSGAGGVYLKVGGSDDSPPVIAPPPPPPPAAIQQAVTPPVNLASIIDVSKRAFERNYVKNTMLPIDSENLLFRNTSSDITVTVRLTGIQGVTFDPSTFTLSPQGNQIVETTFDVVQVNNLPEGTSTMACVMALSSNTVITVATPPAPPIAPPPQVPQPSPVAGLWFEERFQGSPDQMPEAAIFSQAPVSTQNVPVINIIGTAPAGFTTRWTKTQNFDGGNYQINITTDDGMKVLVDGQVVLNAWRDQSPTQYNTTRFLTAGSHTLQVLYYNDRGPGTAVFSIDLINESNPVPVPPQPITPLPVPVPPPVIKLADSPPAQIPAPRVWVSGYEGGLNFGDPPDGWVQDPFGGCWYRPDDPYVLSGWGRGAVVVPPPPPPPPIPAGPPPIPPGTIFQPPATPFTEPIFTGGGGGGGITRFVDDNGNIVDDGNSRQIFEI